VREARRAYGSRLDQPWIPNAVVRAIRRLSLRQAEAGALPA